MSSPGVAYNANDPVQQQFLSSLALGETGNSSFASSEGVGGTNLNGLPTDQFGFPEWTGLGSSHAAGIYQFQPGTFDAVASQYNLNFANPSDQSAAAWYTAQQADPTLESDLSSGAFGKVQAAIQGIWPSVTGNAASPQGLASDLASGIGATIPGPSGAAPVSSTGAASGSSTTGVLGAIENWFLRGGLIFLGAIIVVVALYFLLSKQGYIPKVSSL